MGVQMRASLSSVVIIQSKEVWVRSVMMAIL